MSQKTETVKVENSLEIEEEIPLPEEGEPPAAQENTQDVTPTPVENNSTPDGIQVVTKWGEVLAILRATCPIIAGVLQDSSAYIEGDRLLIDAPNSQFRTLVNGNNAIYRDNIRKAAETVLGRVYKLGPYHAKTTVTETNDPLQSFAQKLKQLENN